MPQKKYTSREMILRDIAAAERKHKRLLAAAQIELDAEKFYEGTENIVDKKNHRDEADRLLGKAKRLKETRLRKLGLSFAAFDTQPLPVAGLDLEQTVLGG